MYESPIPVVHGSLMRHTLRSTITLRVLFLGALCISLTACGPQSYPLRTCVVCDQSLGSHGGPVIFVYEKQRIEVCGEEHRAKFLKDPARYLAKIRESKFL